MKNTLFLKKNGEKIRFFIAFSAIFRDFCEIEKNSQVQNFWAFLKGDPVNIWGDHGQIMGRSWAIMGRSWAMLGFEKEIFENKNNKNILCNFLKKWRKTTKTFYFIFWKKCFSYIRCAKRTWPDPGLSNKSGTVQPGPVTMLSNRPFVVPGFQGRSRDDFARPIPPLKSFILTIYLIVPQ